MSGSLPSVASLLPHEPPMVLLDEAISFEGDVMVCGVEVRPDAPFVGPDGVEGVVLMEYMAQCVGVWAGQYATTTGGEVQIGFIIACRKMELSVDRVPIGASLRVESRRVWGEMALGQFACRVTRDDAVLATASLSVYRGELPPEGV